MHVLIMTYIINTAYPSLSITTAEFATEQSCRYAGAQQEAVIRNDYQRSTKTYTFICVPK